MTFLTRLSLGYCFLLAALLLVSCAQGEVVQNPEVTFDGVNCRYEGPKVVSEGDVTFIFNNISDQARAHLHVMALAEGTTWQEILDLADEGPIVSPPSELRELYPVSVEEDAIVYALKPGSHGVFCVIHGVYGSPAAPLEVES